MKKQIRKKAAPKTQKVDLSCVNFCAVAQLLLVFAFGLAALISLSNISNDVRSIRFSVDELEDNTYRSLNNLREVNSNLRTIDWELAQARRASKEKAGKK